jgi:23S rRNA (adenine2503-C2)-methyltransferase
MSENKKKVQLKGKTIPELKSWFAEIGEKSFRGEQAFNWMYNYLVDDYESILNFSKPLREKLKEIAILNTLELVDESVSHTSGTVKLLLKTELDHLIECVIIPEEKRCTLCVSTQVGCPLDCKFCATGLMGYKRNLTAGEIFDQYAIAQRLHNREITNIVYMGMGEPLLNYDATVKTLEIFAQEVTKGITLKRITVSTAGIAPRIRDLADTGLRPKLALSLHSCYEDIRNKIMPINEKYSLKANIEAIEYYIKTTNTKITYEYTLLEGINDRDQDIKALGRLCRRMPSKVNLIPFNSLERMNPQGFSAELRGSSRERIEEFAEGLRNEDAMVMVRDTQGSEIAAACGQLAGLVVKRDE